MIGTFIPPSYNFNPMQPFGEIADIIKDLSEAEFYSKKCCHMSAIDHVRHDIRSMTQAEKLAMKTELQAVINEIK